MSPPKPIIAGHILITDPDTAHVKPASWSTIPNIWRKIRFDAMDVLYVSPFSVLPNKGFGLKPLDGKLDALAKRFEWIVANARAAKEDIKIIAMNMYGSDEGYMELHDNKDVKTYADSVAAFIDTWSKKTLSAESGKTVSARIDGYDIDYEPNTVQPNAPAVLSLIRKNLDELSSKHQVPRFQVSASSDRTLYLEKLAPVLDYVNMQNYDGGVSVAPSTYPAEIKDLQYSQLLYGISSEKAEYDPPSYMNREETLEAIKKKDLKSLLKAENKHQYAGIMVWRLNSDVWVYENTFQVMLYNQIHGTTLKQLPEFAFADDAMIFKEWNGKSRDENGKIKKPWADFPYN